MLNASGKTRLGVELARSCRGEIVSVDSRQVYRRMDICTGKDLAEYRTPDGAVPHHLIDIADPAQVYTLWQYQRDFYRVFREIRTRGSMPLAVGGTGVFVAGPGVTVGHGVAVGHGVWPTATGGNAAVASKATVSKMAKLRKRIVSLPSTSR